MIAAGNVHGNVFEYDTDLDVYGAVFYWPEGPEPASGGTAVAEFRSRTAVAKTRSRTVVAPFRSRTAVLDRR